MKRVVLEIRPIDILDRSQAETGERWNAVAAGVQQELYGDKGSAWSLSELQARQRGPDMRRINLAAWMDGEIVGAARVVLPLLDNDRLARFWPAVASTRRAQGIGSALLSTCERIATEHGRCILQGQSEWPAGGTDAAEGFATRHGYTPAQTVLRSELRLPADPRALYAFAEAPGPADYTIESCIDDLPESWLEDRALLAQRMSTDAPADGADWQEEVWDAGRVRAVHETARAAGRRVVESVARHRPSGRLVGFTRVELPPDRPDLAFQEDTLVLREHRGHGLGLRLKAVTALVLTDAFPDVKSVRTWNAASNEHMRAVNRRLGYVVDGYTREWQKVLS